MDLVGTGSGRGEGLKRKTCQPECEAVIDEGGDWPVDKESEGDWEDTWVEAVKDGVPQHLKLSNKSPSVVDNLIWAW